MFADENPPSALDRQIRNQRGLFRLTLVLGFPAIACFIFHWVSGLLFCLMGTCIALAAWFLSPPWVNPLDPD